MGAIRRWRSMVACCRQMKMQRTAQDERLPAQCRKKVVERKSTTGLPTLAVVVLVVEEEEMEEELKAQGQGWEL